MRYLRLRLLTGLLVLWPSFVFSNPLDWNLNAELFGRYENKNITSIEVTGLTPAEKADIWPALTAIFSEGEKLVFRFQSLVNSRTLINDYLRGRGFVYSHLGNIGFKDGVLKLVVWRRPIKKILYRGRLANANVARFLGINPGKEYNLHIVEANSRRLYRNPEFQNVEKVAITPYLKKDNGLVVELKVNEKSVSDFFMQSSLTPLRGADAELDFKLKEFYNTRNTFHAKLRGISTFEQVRYIRPTLGLSDVDNPDEKNPLRYHLFLSAEVQPKQKLNTGIDSGIVLPATSTMGIDLGMYLLKRDSQFRTLSRWLGFHNAGLNSLLQAKVFPGSYGEYTIGLSIDDKEYVILPYMASKLSIAGGIGHGIGQAKPMIDSQLDYYMQLYGRQHLRLDLAYRNGRETRLLPLGVPTLAQGLLWQRLFLPNYGTAGIRYYIDVWQLLFMGPAVHYLYVPDEIGLKRHANNWASLGWTFSYDWSPLQLNGGVHYAFAGNHGEWSGGIWSLYYF